ncbi:MAG: hypothetical protein IOC88_13745 [Rhodobacter sp.]|nr:hypothetical protein [Rhodobacter sp.]
MKAAISGLPLPRDDHLVGNAGAVVDLALGDRFGAERLRHADRLLIFTQN